jgi:uncharacterized protein (DUF1800 family)
MFFAPARRPPRPFDRPRDGRFHPRRELPGGEYPMAGAMRRWSRSRRAPSGVPAGSPESLPPPPPLATLVTTRAGFGPRPGDVAAFQALGSTDLERLTAWTDRQLAPAAIVDTECDQRLAASGYVTLGKTPLQLWQDHYLPDNEWDERIQPATETELATWTRAVYSRRQLFESIVHFWHNHFNVYAYEFVEGPMWVQWDRDVIRANALGNFRQMLEAVCQAPSMLVYLDNFLNFAVDGVGYSNENFGRELLELHTLGADAYYGQIPRDQVPLDPQGRPLGYCEDDMRDVSRALTAWTFDIDWIWPLQGLTGRFLYFDEDPNGAGTHSTEAKTVLGVGLPAGRGARQDGAQLLDVLASHPANGRFLAQCLCRRLVGDQPPQALLDSAADLWTSLWQDPDQIGKVVRHILVERSEFRTTWAEKIKRPFEVTVSALRAADASFRFFQQVPAPPDWNDWDPDFQLTATLHWLYEPAGQEIFGWHPPNGHPDVRAAWQCATPRVALWRTVDWLVETDDNGDDRFFDIVGWTLAALPAGGRSTTAVVDVWIDRLLARPIPGADRDRLIEYLGQGFNPGLDLPLDTNDWPYYWQDRLRGLVGLIFMAPEFLWR